MRILPVDRNSGAWLGYDGLNRLRSFATATGSMAENVDYDLNTNPVAVRRCYQSNMTTDAVLSYDGNRLTGVSDVSSDAKMGTVPQIAAGDYADAIAYDAVGRPVRDDMRGITSISYHRACNRPKRIEFGSKGRLDFDYMPDGRLRAQTYSRAAVRSAVRVPGGLGPAAGDSVPAVRDSSRFEAAIVPVSERRFYGCYERVDGQMRVNTGFGHYSFADSTHRWYVKDWKGSVRHTAYQNKATGKMSFGQHTFVYPSGLPVITSNPGNIDRFHQDKRWIDAEGLDMYDNLARMYDPIYVHFTTPDELAEEFRGHSPWAYCLGNPVMRIDTDGRISVKVDQQASDPGNQYSCNVADSFENSINNDSSIPVESEQPTIRITGVRKHDLPTAIENTNKVIAGGNIALGLKNDLIQWADPLESCTYVKACKFMGYVGAGANLLYTGVKEFQYISHGGNDTKVFVKFHYDYAATILPFVLPKNPIAIATGVAVSAGYFIANEATDGFGTDEIIENQINQQQ